MSDVLRLFLTTDNHLGFKEKDAIRGLDTFTTFEEALFLAQRLKCDLLLQAGDLFDIQRPSQITLCRTIRTLSRYVVGSGDHHFKVTKRHDDRPAYNFEQVDQVSIALPVFMIHGNHDPPLGIDGSDPVSPVDILEASGLINDIGKCNDFDEVVIKPVILAKGGTKVALYGLGHIRDERMHRIFSLEKITFQQPEEGDDCFCILLIHQNRYKGAFGGLPAKSCVHEEMLPSWLDLVIWGHEHDCDIEPQDSLKGGYHISQPGSTVVTSLGKGDATFKRNAILEVSGRKFRLHSFPLLTTRPFVFEDLKAASLCSVQAADKDLWPELTKVVEKCLDDAKCFVKEREDDWDTSMNKCISDIIESSDAAQLPCKPNVQANFVASLKAFISSLAVIDLPLIRVRVDLTGGYDIDFSTARFGSQFVGRLANAEDILATSRGKEQRVKDKSSETVPAIEIVNSSVQDAHDLIFHHIGDHSALDMLVEFELNAAVKRYVDRADPAALETTVAKHLWDTQSTIKRVKRENPDTDVKLAIQDMSRALRQPEDSVPVVKMASPSPSPSSVAEEAEADPVWDDAANVATTAMPATLPPESVPTTRMRKSVLAPSSSDSESDPLPVKPLPKRAPKAKAKAKGKSKSRAKQSQAEMPASLLSSLNFTPQSRRNDGYRDPFLETIED